ncbi:MAG: VCBS repeat-containing protein [Ilyomonas sp.]
MNNDGLPDIYVSTTIKANPQQRRNLLYVNQGLNNDKIPVFKEEAAEYGLADTSFSVHAAFFDYDNDGDLDMYLVTTKLIKRESASFNTNARKSNRIEFDKLYRNDWNDSLQHPVFTDVSKEAGILHTGLGLGVAIVDINKDGWKDIYVTNDFFGSDHLYINNKNGTFSDKIREYFKHTSLSAMGNDVADINNDGLPDVIAVDMNPEDNFRKKKNLSSGNYYVYQRMQFENLELQYVRNTLQLNMGPRVNENDSIGDPAFSEISFLAGIAQTDWSWTPSLADFDNDGYRDLIVTNGYPRDVTDHDFVAYRNKNANFVSKKDLIAQIPQIKIPNYAYRNGGNLKFEDVSKKWGMSEPSFSNGAVYVDLDNDGDLDYVINNINDEASVYENTLNAKDNVKANYLEIAFKGNEKNVDGIGATATIYYGKDKMQFFENSPYRGYLSTVSNRAFFGLDSVKIIDSVIINWGNKKQLLNQVPVNKLLTVDIKSAVDNNSVTDSIFDHHTLFTDVTASSNVHYVHSETEFIDFNDERLLPHKFSQYAPGLATGDVDGNGLDDIYIGSSSDFSGVFLLQQKNGKFIQKNLQLPVNQNNHRPKSMGVLLFDIDNDGNLDLYCASGSNESPSNTNNYEDQLFINDGKGNFSVDTSALPRNYTSKSCIKAVDIDNDGDLDLFIGGRVLPGSYPMPVSSCIYRNDSKPGHIKFTDITNEVAKDLQDIGMVCDAIWTDFDNDGWTDLIVVGEWMPVTFFKNNHGKFENVSASSGINDQKGWWNSIAGGDFDNDGDIDYIVGNLGENSFLQASDQYPVNVYAKDFDKNGSIDAILTVFLKDEKGEKKEFTAFNRDDIVDQLPSMKKKYLTYKSFGVADIHDIFPDSALKTSLHLQVNNQKSCYLKNLGNGKFEMHALPVTAQFAPVFGIVVTDANNDGNLDVVLSGNDFGNEVSNGRYDALNGLVLLGDGKGNFASQSILQSGIYIPGNAKALVQLRSENGCLIAASQNRGPLKLFKQNAPQKNISLKQDDKVVFVHLKNGSQRKEEVYHGNSFLSQSSLFIPVNEQVKSIEIVNNKGEKRTINF